MRRITGVIVHCTATRPDWWLGKRTSEKVAEIRRWHMEDRKWRDIGYHFLIDRDGTVAKGRPIEQDGAHVQGHNRSTIGVSLFGGHGSSETDAFADNFTAAQDKALRGLLADLRAKYGNVPVTGHNEYAAKACPGFKLAAWLTPEKTPVEAPKADWAPTPAAKPATGLWAALVAALAAWFTKGRK
jgi:N-acetylmuramoyl-L-alanine amidase